MTCGIPVTCLWLQWSERHSWCETGQRTKKGVAGIFTLGTTSQMSDEHTNSYIKTYLWDCLKVVKDQFYSPEDDFIRWALGVFFFQTVQGLKAGLNSLNYLINPVLNSAENEICYT